MMAWWRIRACVWMGHWIERGGIANEGIPLDAMRHTGSVENVYWQVEVCVAIINLTSLSLTLKHCT